MSHNDGKIDYNEIIKNILIEINEIDKGARMQKPTMNHYIENI